MFRWFLRGFGLASLCLLAVIAYRTSQFTVPDHNVTPIQPRAFDTGAVVRRYSEALRYPTVSHIDRTRIDYAPFVAFRKFLERSYPAVYQSLGVQVVGGHSLLFRWNGSDPSLAPIVLMGHYDVVPAVEDGLIQWEHPPFSGAVADGFIWGRGAIDNKNNVVLLLEAVTELLQDGFQPKRSVFLAFGHDEEIGGRQGAKLIVDQLEIEGISPAMVLDEGGVVSRDPAMGLGESAALIGIAEKGYISLRLTAYADSGHSSMPPRDTAIGRLARALNALEENRFPLRLTPVTEQFLESFGPKMGLSARVLIANRWLFEPLLLRGLAAQATSNPSVRTTTALTMLDAGIKDNILPAEASAVVNFRTLPGDTESDVIDHVRRVTGDDGLSIETVSNFSKEATPASDTEGTAYQALRTSIQELFPDTPVGPYLVFGGTDSNYYYRLCDRVYRFSPVSYYEGDRKRFHGVNERIRIDGLTPAIEFYIRLIERMDAAG